MGSIKTILFIFGISFFTYLQGETLLKGRIYPLDTNLASPLEVSLGESFSAVIELWPKDLWSDLTIEDLQLQPWLDSLFILRIDKMTPSENNSDVWIIHAQVVVIGEFVAGTTYFWRKDGHELTMIPEHLIYNDLITQSHERSFIYWIEDVTSNPSQSLTLFVIFAFVGALALVGGGIFFRIYFIKKQKMKEEKIHLQLLVNRFKSAKIRCDFEKLFQQQKQWPFSWKNSEKGQLFLLFISTNQYKKSWSPEELKYIQALSIEIPQEQKGGPNGTS